MTFGTEFWAAIMGAVVGGVIALIIQLVAIYAGKKERMEDKLELRKMFGYSVMFKMMRIFSNLSELHSHLEESYARVDPSCHNEPWQFVQEVANIPDNVHFTSQEMSFILSLESKRCPNPTYPCVR